MYTIHENKQKSITTVSYVQNIYSTRHSNISFHFYFFCFFLYFSIFISFFWNIYRNVTFGVTSLYRNSRKFHEMRVSEEFNLTDFKNIPEMYCFPMKQKFEEIPYNVSFRKLHRMIYRQHLLPIFNLNIQSNCMGIYAM